MARTAKRPCEIALEVMPLGKAVTPEVIDKHVGRRKVSSHIWNLRQLGFVIDVEKSPDDNRVVVSYTISKEPDNAADIRAGVRKSKAKKEKPAKVVKAKKEAAPKKVKVSPKVKKAPSVAEKNLKTIKKVAERKNKLAKEVAEVLKSEPTATSFAVDPDWDSADELNIRDLV